MVRLFHFSDTHLGHQQFSRTDASGLNQREQDMYAAFHRVIDQAVADRPDLVIHAGDLFDGVRPGNRALAHAMEGFLKLSRAGIPTVVIAGNHEHPRLRETGSPLRLFEHLPHVHVAYQSRLETRSVATPSGPVRVHAVPQCADGEALAAEVASIPRGTDGVPDVLVVHGAVRGIPAFSHGELNELDLEPSWFDDRFAYVALGHYHHVQQVNPRAWYCGSPERASLAEAGQEKGFLDVRLAAGAPPDVRFVPLPTRPALSLPPLDASRCEAAETVHAARALLAPTPEGSIVRLRVTGIPTSQRGALDVGEIRKASAHTLHLDLRLEWADAALDVRGAADIRGLADEWDAFAARQPLQGLERDRVLAKARALLEASP